MAERYVTLHPEDNPEDELYPNIKPDNIEDLSITDSKIGGVSWSKVTGKPIIPNRTSQLVNDSGYLTNIAPLSIYDSMIVSLSWEKITSKPTIPTKTSELTNDSGYITQASIDDKLDKVMTSSEYGRVYAVALDGSQTMLNVSMDVGTHYTLVMRDGFGRFEVLDPVHPKDPTNKKYVDDKFKSTLSYTIEEEL